MPGWRSLGLVTVTTAGQAVRITFNQASPTARLDCFDIMVQAKHSNTGRIGVHDSSAGNITTYTNVLANLAVPTANSIPSANAGILTQAETRFDASQYFIDATVSGESAAISVLTDEL